MRETVLRGSLSDAIDVRENYDYILVCLWSDKDTSLSVVKGVKQCKHFGVEENKHCASCGAWVGNIGEEENTLETYEHIFWLAGKLKEKCKTLIFKSDFPIPTYYKGRGVLESPFKNISSHHLFSRAVMASAFGIEFKAFCYMTVFSDEKIKMFESSSLCLPDLCISGLLDRKALIVNPDRYEIKNSVGKNYLVCNTKIDQLLLDRY